MTTSSVRTYLPTTLRGLAELAASGEVAPTGGHAVTDAVRAEWQDSSEEEWEYEALCLAADDCAALWAEDDERRRVVLAVDVDAAAVRLAESGDRTGAGDPTEVVVTRAVPLRDVAAVHADLSEADAERRDDLCWFATQELDQLLDRA
ncbi:hypothetical protein GCM10011519_33200 [Marmoricola endophyticus]|uniref:Uncharacterized protein n=1 Tax=Marmoricola endophyticus TaxID=2040280 RepID=A0A917F6W8_9ACTN|nr:hypothetical protein [Marmoricola endophyticus]GGF56659.1 hypothetical protein GCM10011519_33200 [Marmoricola endophyticus]